MRLDYKDCGLKPAAVQAGKYSKSKLLLHYNQREILHYMYLTAVVTVTVARFIFSKENEKKGRVKKI